MAHPPLDAAADFPLDPAELAAAEALDQYLNAVAADGTAELPADLPPDDLAAFLLGRSLQVPIATSEPPAPPFVTQLRDGLRTALTPTEPAPTTLPRRRASRRAFLAGGLGAAAGLAAGVGAAVLVQPHTTAPGTTTPPAPPLVGLAGAWVTVAQVGELAPGAVKRFATDQIVGHLMHQLDGTYLALSAACTHMGCIVAWNGPARTFDCPCHAGRFTAAGQSVPTIAANPIKYTPLPQLATQILDTAVQVFVPSVPGVTPVAHQTPTPHDPDGGYKP